MLDKATRVSLELKVGAVIVAMLAIVGWMSLKIGENIFGQSGYHLYVTFKSAQSLYTETQVSIAGVGVGTINEIQLTPDGHARLELIIKYEFEIYEDAVATVATKGIIGEKMILIEQGTPGSYVLQDGDTIINVKNPVEMTEIMEKIDDIAGDLQEVTGTLRRTFGTDEGEETFRSILRDLRETTRRLAESVEFSQGRFERTIDNIALLSDTLREEAPDMMSDLRRVSQSLEQLVTGNQDQINDTIENLSLATSNLNNSLERVASVAKKVDEGQGTVGQLINNEETARKLNSTIDGISTMVDQMQQLKVYLKYRGEYQFIPNTDDPLRDDIMGLKSYIEVRLQPREDKYYSFEIIDDPQGYTQSTKTEVYSYDENGNIVDTDIEEKFTNKSNSLKFSLQFARRFWNIVLRGGVIESTGGMGADLYLIDDRIMFSVEAFDWGREPRPYLKATLSIEPIKHIFLCGGANDFIRGEYGPVYFFGAGIKFADDDIKLLLSSIPIPGG
jgi:phospholipid/cholesterol/gamma-HCH transport system substrate-binding protein